MKDLAVILGIALFSIIVFALKFKFNSYIFGEGGLFGPEDHSLSHEIKNLVSFVTKASLMPRSTRR